MENRKQWIVGTAIFPDDLDEPLHQSFYTFTGTEEEVRLIIRNRCDDIHGYAHGLGYSIEDVKETRPGVFQMEDDDNGSCIMTAEALDHITVVNKEGRVL